MNFLNCLPPAIENFRQFTHNPSTRTLAMHARFAAPALLALALLLTGCQQESPASGEPAADAADAHPHEHQHAHPHSHDHFFTTRTQTRLVPLPKEEGVFHFVVYGDRTGGVPAGLAVLRQAVADTNLLDPDLVMTVGDLVQGYNKTPVWLEQTAEFREIMDGLHMPWYPVAGNHDVYWDPRDPQKPAGQHEASYEKHFGPLWYAFRHKNAGFVVLYSDEGNPETGDKGFNRPDLQTMSQEQLDFLEQALEYQREQDHVFVFLHHPRWLGNNYGDNWAEVHKRLAAAGNVSAVFAGHIHRMRYDGVRDGIEYFTLATTGGHLGADAPEIGYLHHFNVITVRKEGFSAATIPVGAVVDPKQFTADFLADVEAARRARPQSAGEPLAMAIDGSAQGEHGVEFSNPSQRPLEVTVVPEASRGWSIEPDHAHATIAPGEKAKLSFRFQRGPIAADGNSAAPGDFQPPLLNASLDYLGENARIRLPDARLPVAMNLADVPDGFFQNGANHCLALAGELQCVHVDSTSFNLPQGPFTLEAWVQPAKHESSQGVIAKTQSSEYALFMEEGVIQFDVYLNGRYVTAHAADRLPTERWSHVAGVFDGESVKLFVDGKLIESVAGSGRRGQNQLPLLLGADPTTDGSPTRPFHGKLDEVRLSRVARYTEGFEPAARFTPDNDTELLFHFDKSVGPFVLDESKPYAAGMLLNGARLEAR